MRELPKHLPTVLPEHRLTLAMLVTGLLRSRDGRLTKIAEKVVYPHKKPSLVSRFERFVKSSWVTVTTLYAPLAAEILQAVATDEPIVLIIDSTKLGGCCLCLMVSVYYKKRALPIAWSCLKGKKGHSSQLVQLELLQQVEALLPTNSPVVLVGDGEFDGADLLSWLSTQSNWQFVCRTSASNLFWFQGKWLSLTEIVTELALAPTETAFLTDGPFIHSHPVDGLNILIGWHHTEQKHIFFVTNCTTAAEAQQWYEHRFTIETCFADLKSRGFSLDQSRIRTPERLERFILAAAFAYYLVIVLGIESIFSGVFRRLVRTDAFYHSLSQLGFIYLDDILNQGERFPDLPSLPNPHSVTHIVLPP